MRRTTTFALIALLLTALTACSPPRPDPYPTAAPPTIEIPAPVGSPSPVPLIPSFVVITPQSVTVGATTQQVIEEVPFTTDPRAAAAALSAAMNREPVRSTIAATDCSAESTVWDWGGLRIIAPAPDGAELGAQFIARATARATGNGLNVDIRFGAVGVPLADVVRYNTESGYSVVSEDLGGGYGVAMLDGQDGGTWGVIMVVESGIVTSFYSPGLFNSADGGC